MASSPFEPVANAFVEALVPLSAAAKDPKLLQLLIYELGWVQDISDEVLGAMPWLATAAEIVDEAQALIAEFEDGDDDVGGAILQALALVDDVMTLIRELEDNPPNGAALTGILADPDFWTELALDLPEYLLLRWLRLYKPLLYRVLCAAEVVTEETVPGSGGRAGFVRRSLTWRNLTSLLSDPPAYLQERYEWGGADGFKHDELLSHLAMVAKAGGMKARLRSLSTRFIGDDAPYASGSEAASGVRQLDLPIVTGPISDSAFVEMGVALVPVPKSPSASGVSGLLLSTLSAGDASVPIVLSDEWTLVVEGTVDATGAVGLMLQPGSDPTFTSLAPDSTLRMTLRGTPEAPWVLVGAADGTRLELRGFEASLSLGSQGSTPELVLEAGGIDADTALGIVIDAGEGDSFLNSLLESIALDIAIDPRLRWSSIDGFTFGGAAGFDVEIPIDSTLGPITIDSLTIAFTAAASADDTALRLTAGVTASAVLGPLAFAVDNIGLAFELSNDPAGLAIARFGDLNFAIGFKPPDGLGLAIDAGVASGGGYLYIDADKGQYAGVAAVEAMGIGITAIALIATELPDGSDGWSMFLSLSATFTGVQLGFGFTLNGVGGLAGINRGIDVEALQQGLRDGALDSILFPEDPIADAPRILADIDAIFPPAVGQYVFGPVAVIGWGTPSLIEAEVGIMIELPDPVTIVVMGSVQALLPTPDAAIVELRMDVLGIIEFDTGTLSIDATLRDSKVLALTLTGDMAMRASFIDNPTFLLSVGGFHPAFTPPADFPTLRLLAIALDTGDNLRIQLGCYFAITSNTLQFGAGASLWATALGCTVEGAVTFDALIQFSPFGFIVALGLYVSVKAGSVELAGVYLVATLTGPNEWFVSGTATFKILGIKKAFKVEATFGAKEDEDALQVYDVKTLLLDALSAADAWCAVAPDDADAVVLAETSASDAIRVHPAGSVEVRQKIVPLERTLDKFGNGVLGGLDYFSLDNPSLGGEIAGASATVVEDWFAAAQFFETSDADALSSPSFEQMPAGLRFGDDGIDAGEATPFEIGYEQVVRDSGRSSESRRLTERYQPQLDSLLGAVGRSTAATSRRKRGFTMSPTASSPAASSFGISAVTYAVMTDTDGAVDATVTPTAVPWSKAREALRSADKTKGRQIVPAYELAS